MFAAQGQGLAGGVVGFVAVGLASGALLAALREAESGSRLHVLAKRLRRRLHDGVLQAFAIVRRRTDDADSLRWLSMLIAICGAFLDRGDAGGRAGL